MERSEREVKTLEREVKALGREGKDLGRVGKALEEMDLSAIPTSCCSKYGEIMGPFR